MKALGDRCLGQRKRWERGCWGSSTCTGVGSESVICRRYEQPKPEGNTMNPSEAATDSCWSVCHSLRSMVCSLTVSIWTAHCHPNNSPPQCVAGRLGIMCLCEVRRGGVREVREGSAERRHWETSV